MQCKLFGHRVIFKSERSKTTKSYKNQASNTVALVHFVTILSLQSPFLFNNELINIKIPAIVAIKLTTSALPFVDHDHCSIA